MSFYFARSFFYLCGEQGNSAESEVFHRSIHKTKDGAKNVAENLVTPEDLAGKNANNKWHEETWEYEDLLVFRTGHKNCKVFSIHPLPLQV